MVSSTFFSLRNGIVILLATILLSVFSFSVVSAQKGQLCRGANLTFSDKGTGGNITCKTDGQGNPQDQGQRIDNLIAAIVNIFSIIVGIVAVIMIIVGGFKFITSGGDSGKVTSARNTIIYAIVGLIVVALAQFIVKFVLTKLP